MIGIVTLHHLSHPASEEQLVTRTLDCALDETHIPAVLYAVGA